jgi:hypothetical protein
MMLRGCYLDSFLLFILCVKLMILWRTREGSNL